MDIELKKINTETGVSELTVITLDETQTKFLVQFALNSLIQMGYFKIKDEMDAQIQEVDDQINSLPDDAFFKA